MSSKPHPSLAGIVRSIHERNTHRPVHIAIMLPPFKIPVFASFKNSLIDLSHLLLVLPQADLVLQLVRQSFMNRPSALILVCVALTTTLYASQSLFSRAHSCLDEYLCLGYGLSRAPRKYSPRCGSSPASSCAWRTQGRHLRHVLDPSELSFPESQCWLHRHAVRC